MNKNVPIDLHEFSYDYEKYPPIGIDFGTSNSAIAKWVNTIKHTGTRVYTLNDQVQYLMPSFVYLDSDGEFIAGKGAYNKRIAEPDRVAACVKRKISDQSNCIPLADTFFSPIDITAKIIQAILKSCMDTGLEKPAGIVVSVPYYFTQNQNNNIRTAVNQALQQMPQFSCLSVEQRPKLLGLIPEPVAAALSFSIANMESAMDDCVLLYDMGGGTLDISILQLNISGPDIHFEILATDGDDSFGGEDFDHILEQYVVENSAISFNNLDEKLKRRQKGLIRTGIVSAKEDLSYAPRIDLFIGNLPCGQNIDIQLKRSEFESLLCDNCNGKNYYDKFVQILDRTITKSKVLASAITKILPVGGSTRIPFFRKIIENRLPQAKYLNAQQSDNDPLFLSVARGAAIYAAYLLDNQTQTRFLPVDRNLQIIQRTSHNLGIHSNNGRFSIIVKANQPVPERVEKRYEPIAYCDASKKCIRARAIDVYQGNSDYVFDNTHIGTIRLPVIYAHGRALEQVKINIEFYVTATNIIVSIIIPESNKDRSDIHMQTDIHLEEK